MGKAGTSFSGLCRGGASAVVVTIVAAATMIATATPAAATFIPGASVAVGAYPVAVAVGDFNGDKAPDMAVANFGSDDISLRFGNGTGSFANGPVLTAGDGPTAIAVGHFNGDSLPDLAVVNQASNDVWVRMSDGAGFGPATVVPVGVSPSRLAVGDFNGDARSDLVVANDTSGTVSVRLGNGLGGFSAAPDVNVGGRPEDLVVGDFNGDTKADFAVAVFGLLVIDVRLGDGAGGFAAAPAKNAPALSLVAGDFNRDGNVDLAYSDQFDFIYVLLGNGNGTFVSVSRLQVGVRSTHIAVADFNGDGNPDLAVTNFESGSVSVRLGDGTGNFTAVPDVGAGARPVWVDVGDFNLDRKPDLAVVNAERELPASAGGVTVLLNQFTFPPPQGAYRPLTPTRIVDSRFGPGVVGSIPPHAERSFVVTGVGGVPATGVSVVVLNVVATDTAAGGYFTVYPTGAPRPNAANLNWDGGETVPNLVQMRVGVGGQVTVFNGSPGAANIVVDVSGWFTDSAAGLRSNGLFTPVVPTRLADTRPGSKVGPNATIGPNGVISITVAGSGQAGSNPVPASGVGAVVLNVTAVTPAAAGYVTIHPSGEARPLAANLNFVAGQIVPNRVIAKVGTNGQVDIFNGSAGTVDVVVDVGGWFTSATSAAGGARYTGLVPNRITDTRPPPFRIGPSATVGPHASITVAVAGTPGVPAMNASSPPRAVVLNVAVTNAEAPGFLTVYPGDTGRPLAADQNWPPGDTRSNLVVVKVGAGGTITLFNGSSGTLDVIVDVVGWY